MTILEPQELSAARILIFAPHPDDESLGCGGLIALLSSYGRTVHTVFVTDGGASHLQSPSWNRARLVTQRRLEAAEALRRLGAGDQPRSFLALPDAAMPERQSKPWNTAVSTVARIVEELDPELVLLPWRRDPHCDHRDTWQLAMDALACAAPTTAFLEYAIWLDELGASEDWPSPDEAEQVVFDIDAVLQLKRDAVHAHLSQTTDLIPDDPSAFRLSAETIHRLTGPDERYWRPVP